MKKERKLRLVMTGTHPQGQGGVSAVVSTLLEAGLFERIPARYLVSHVGDGFWSKLAVALAAPWRMLYICWSECPDIVHAHCATGASFVRKSVLLSIARRCGCATVLHLHGARFREFAIDEAGWLRRRWVRRVLRRSSAVIALSESWARFVHQLVADANVHVIPNAVAVPDAPEHAAPEPRRILFLGQVGRRKGVYDLIDAVARVKNEFPDVRLVIGGDGELGLAAERVRRHELEAHVQLLGWIGADERARQLRSASMLCLPSYNEGVPMAMLEAMAAARAVIVTPVGGIADVIDDGVQGVLVPPGDVEALARTLRRLLGDPAASREMGLRAYRTMRERFHADTMVEQLVVLYDQLRPEQDATMTSHTARPPPG